MGRVFTFSRGSGILVISVWFRGDVKIVEGGVSSMGV